MVLIESVMQTFHLTTEIIGNVVKQKSALLISPIQLAISNSYNDELLYQDWAL